MCLLYFFALPNVMSQLFHSTVIFNLKWFVSIFFFFSKMEYFLYFYELFDVLQTVERKKRQKKFKTLLRLFSAKLFFLVVLREIMHHITSKRDALITVLCYCHLNTVICGHVDCTYF